MFKTCVLTGKTEWDKIYNMQLISFIYMFVDLSERYKKWEKELLTTDCMPNIPSSMACARSEPVWVLGAPVNLGAQVLKQVSAAFQPHSEKPESDLKHLDMRCRHHKRDLSSSITTPTACLIFTYIYLSFPSFSPKVWILIWM